MTEKLSYMFNIDIFNIKNTNLTINTKQNTYTQNKASSSNMQVVSKIRSIRLNKNKIKSPSPDTKNHNIVQKTFSPIQQIQQFLAISKEQAKLRQQLNRTNNIINMSINSSNHHHKMSKNQSVKSMKSQAAQVNSSFMSSNEISYQKQEKYKQRIRQLEQQLQQYKQYNKQYQQLVEKNKKLQEQMAFLLQQLQRRYGDEQIQQQQQLQMQMQETQIINQQLRHGNVNIQDRIHKMHTSADQHTNQSSPIRSQDETNNLNFHKSNYQYNNINKTNKNVQKMIQYSPSSNHQQQQQTQFQYLHDYVQGIQELLYKIKKQTTQMESQLRKDVKKDMNDMEHRLMSYIFGLEERVTEATFKNHNLQKKLQTFRQSRNSIIYQNSNQKDNKDNLNDYVNSIDVFDMNNGRSRKQSQYDSGFFRISNSSDKKQDSIITLSNKEKVHASPSYNNSNEKQQRTVKKQHALEATPKIIMNEKCQKCQKYQIIIDRQAQRIKYLQNSILKQKINMQNKNKNANNNNNNNYSIQVKTQRQSPIYIYDASNPNIQNQTYNVNAENNSIYNRSSNNNNNLLNQIKQVHHQFQQSREQLLSKSFNFSMKSQQNKHGQSNINIMVDSSGQSSFAINQLNTNQNNQNNTISIKDVKQKYNKNNNNKQKSQSNSNVSSSSKQFFKLEKVKDQLVNIMQQIQQLVHECQAQSGTSNKVSQLIKKINQQAAYIAQLQQQISRLHLQIQVGKTKRQQLQKFMKVQVRQQQQAQSPYFRPLKQPIDIIDHNGTKNKIQHIIKSIKKFEWQSKDSKRDSISQNNSSNFTTGRYQYMNTNNQSNTNIKKQQQNSNNNTFLKIHTL